MKETLRIYNHLTEEFLLLDWYHQLVSSGDHYLIFDKDLRYPSNFLNFFKPPRTLAYVCDKSGMWFAYWMDPWLSGAIFGVWFREDHRASAVSVGLFKKAVSDSFNFATTLVTTTKSDEVAEYLKRLGFTFGMSIPALADGEDLHVYTLTRDKWEKKNGSTSRERQ